MKTTDTDILVGTVYMPDWLNNEENKIHYFITQSGQHVIYVFHVWS